jgi:hypothetical protein
MEAAGQVSFREQAQGRPNEARTADASAVEHLQSSLGKEYPETLETLGGFSHEDFR